MSEGGTRSEGDGPRRASAVLPVGTLQPHSLPVPRFTPFRPPPAWSHHKSSKIACWMCTSSMYCMGNTTWASKYAFATKLRPKVSEGPGRAAVHGIRISPRITLCVLCHDVRERLQNFLCRPVGDESLTPFAERDAHQKHLDCRKRRLQFPRPILKVELTCGKESGQDDEPTLSRQILRELAPHPNVNDPHIVL